MPNGHAEGKRSRGGDPLRLEHLPRLRSGYVLRDKFALPCRGLPRTVGVFAPPGFGKTQLLAFWYYELRSRGHEVRWIDGASPDADDRLNARAAADAGEGLAIFIDNADAGLLPSSLPRLLATKQRSNLLFLAGRAACLPQHEFDRRFDQDDLRFGEEEAYAFLRKRMAWACPDTITDAANRCVGVPALLNIAVAELRGNPAPRSSIHRQGSFFAAYVEDCVAHLSESELSLLRDISIPDRFCIDLAVFLSGRPDCGATIERLRQKLPFFLPSQDRCHALLPAFRDTILRGRTDSTRVESVHRAAAHWFADRNRHGEAIDHAVAAGNVELAVDMMGQHLLETVMSGELERVLGWLAAVPRERIMRDSDLCLAAALTYLLAGEAELTTWFLGRLAPDHHIIVLACHSALQERCDTVETLLGQIKSIDDLSPAAAACYSNLYRSVYQRHEGRRSAAPLTPPPLPGRPFRSIRAIGLLLEVERLLMAGKANQAIATVESLAQDCAAELGSSSSVANMLAVSLASACFQAGQFDRADKLLTGRLDVACRHNFPTVPCNALLTAARIEAVRGNVSACLNLLERLEALGIERNLLRLCAVAQAERVRIYASTRQQMLASITLTALEKTQASVHATMAFQSGQVDLEVLLARAHLLQSLGKNKKARLALDTAEALAVKLGRTLKRAEAIILRHSECSGTLTKTLASVAIDKADLDALMAWLRGETGADAARDTLSSHPDFDILGPPVLVQMTDREIQILEGLSRDLSNKAIARELQLSNETVKWYIGRIFVKLGAHDRREAVERARAFGVLPMFRTKPWPQNLAVENGMRVHLSYGGL